MNKSTLSNKLLWRLCLLAFFAVSYWLCRFMFFDIHGMKQFPNLLAIIGLLILLVAFVLKMRLLSVTTILGYIAGFVIGAVFNSDGFDAGGGKMNDLWIIWTVVFLLFIIIGLVLDIFKKHNPTKNSL